MRPPVLLALPFILSGCVAAPIGAMMAASYGMSAATLGVGVYSISEVTRDGRVTFESQRATLPESDVSLVRSARTIAVFPNYGNDNGRVHDLLSERLDLRVVSVSGTMTARERARRQVATEGAAITALPRQEKIDALARMGAGLNADLMLLAEPAGHRASARLFGAPQAEMFFEILLVSSRERRAVWAERVTIRIDGIQNIDTNAFVPVLARGMAERINEIRRGQASGITVSS